MPVIDVGGSVVLMTGGDLVIDPGGGDVHDPVSPEPGPEAPVDILVAGEEVLVHDADLVQHASRVDRGTGHRDEDFGRLHELGILPPLAPEAGGAGDGVRGPGAP